VQHHTDLLSRLAEQGCYQKGHREHWEQRAAERLAHPATTPHAPGCVSSIAGGGCKSVTTAFFRFKNKQKK